VSAAVPDGAPGGTPSLSVNGQARPLGDGTLTGLLEAEAVNTQAVNTQAVNTQAGNTQSGNTQSGTSGARGLAVAVNGQVVPRHAWDATRLAPGDEVEIVKLFAGG
jgi:sulfur carrier protein